MWPKWKRLVLSLADEVMWKCDLAETAGETVGQTGPLGIG